MLLGVSKGDADKYNAEYQLHDRMIPVYQAAGIQPALLDIELFCNRDCSEAELLKPLKRFHAVHLILPEQSVTRFDAAYRRRAPVVGRALARYVAEGGGLLIEPQSVRYRGDEDDKYWNAVLAPLGMAILPEGVFDKTRAFQGQTLGMDTFWRTQNIQPHPVTKGVSSLCLPLHSYGLFPGTVAMQYRPEWQVLVRGLENNGCAALWSEKHPWFRFVAVDEAGTAWFQEDIDQRNAMWAGNVFVCDNKAVKIALVVDGQADGRPPFVELHNPTDEAVHAAVHSPAGAPLFGGLAGQRRHPCRRQRPLQDRWQDAGASGCKGDQVRLDWLQARCKEGMSVGKCGARER